MRRIRSGCCARAANGHAARPSPAMMCAVASAIPRFKKKMREATSKADQQEWKDHAEKWRDSIDADHGAPCGQGAPPRYFNGNLFQAGDALLVELIQTIIDYLEKHWPAKKLDAEQKSMRDKITGYLAMHRARLAAVTSP
jgi:hypothetical protein